ncbi:hypothetical protein D910_08733 [Dendroctonus ponderosae]|uniref:Transposable element P transposase-like RNase H domain-containing protein n=1 Tax=Dendroctonus ponderosae TaxID=77166 RepID=U4UMM6_DENPD|nr:hypothetical protein D910_08733 [Dendroctonus ponderosae]
MTDQVKSEAGRKGSTGGDHPAKDERREGRPSEGSLGRSPSSPDLEESTKKFVGCVDKGSLGRTNDLADHALLFMAQGVTQKWKQPISYYFTKNTISAADLQTLISEVIRDLANIGLHVKCTVCHQGPTNVSALRQKTENNFFFIENGNKIYIFYDSPHLLKSTRNALYKFV